MIQSDASVEEFVAAVTPEVRRRDAETLIDLFARITGEEPRMWGPSSIGFGQYHYKYATGREGDAGAAGFAPRKASTTIYLPDGIAAHQEKLRDLGPHTTGAICLYIKKLADIDLGVLESIIDESYRAVTAGAYYHWAESDSARPAT